MEAEPGAIDAWRFEELVGSGTGDLRTGSLERGAETLRSALELWRSPLSDFTYEDFAQTEIRRLVQIRLGAVEELAAAELSLGHDREVLLLVEEALAEDPLRERCRELQMLALYRTGRHAEALRSYEQFRVLLADELGLEPSPPIRRLQERILLHDPSLGPLPSPEAVTEASVVRNPYKGLRPFGEEDAADFFGRQALVAQLVQVLGGGARLVALVGPSGSGKSSVVMAGLVPALRDGALAGSATWVIARMVPGRRPFDELEAVLAGAAPAGLAGSLPELDAADGALVRAAEGVLPPDTDLLLVIDQFEELFSTGDEAERRRFLRSLAAVASTPQHRVRVVLTLRADFYDRPLLDPDFGPVFSAGVVNVHAMTNQEVTEAVTGPAELVGVDVRPALLAELLSDTAAQPGAFPLLQYGLTELFEDRTGATLTVEEYREGGGMHGLLSRRSEELYAGLDPEHQKSALQVFLRLVTLGSGNQRLAGGGSPSVSSPPSGSIPSCCRPCSTSSAATGS